MRKALAIVALVAAMFVAGNVQAQSMVYAAYAPETIVAGNTSTNYQGFALGFTQNFGLSKGIGILASTDPVALDQACLDIINNQEVTATNDPTDLLSRIDKQHGTHTIEHAEAIGLGTRKYTIVSIDKKDCETEKSRSPEVP